MLGKARGYDEISAVVNGVISDTAYFGLDGTEIDPPHGQAPWTARDYAESWRRWAEWEGANVQVYVVRHHHALYEKCTCPPYTDHQPYYDSAADGGG